jgi:hypothetical protein
MESIGLTVGLTSLFASILSALDRLSAAKSYGIDYHLFTTKLSSERRKLFRWGHAVGLAPGSGVPHELLQDPEIREEVRELLSWAVYFFEDSEGIKKRHGAVVIGYPRERARIQQRSASVVTKMWWALSGKRKAEGLLQELGWFVGRLHELVPTSGRGALDLTDAIRRAMILPQLRVSGIVLSPMLQQAVAPTGTGTLVFGAIAPPDALVEPAGNGMESGLRLINQFGAISHRVENRRLQSSIRRTRLKHARRTSAGAAAEIERKIRASER